MWWEMSFVKLLAECCLVVLWSWGFLGVGGWGSGCRQLPAFLQRSALGPGSLLSPTPQGCVTLGFWPFSHPDKLFWYMGGVPILNVEKLEGFCFLLG